MNILIYSLFALNLASTSLASDGPENSGTFTIGSLTGDQFEANLQVDRKILVNIDSDISTLLSVASGDTICDHTQTAVIESSDVLTTSLVYTCPQGAAVLDISLKALDSLPNNFTMGVRSAVDHFVLTKEAPKVKTILKPEYAFGLAGLTLILDHPILEKAHIGRPHAFFYGGLAVVPSGFYFLLLVAALWLSAFSAKTKWLASVGALVSVAVINLVVADKQASLNILPVRVLGILFLSLITISLLSSFAKTHWSKYIAAGAVTIGTVLAGLELAVMLRWLEGQDAMNRPLIIGSFYLGLAAAFLVVMAVGTLVASYIRKVGTVPVGDSPHYQKARSVSLIAVLFGTLYTLAALILKLQ